jgi:signal transduction histidine kinase
MQEQAKLIDQVATLSGELSHHVNNPLAILMAGLATVERISRDLATQHSNSSEQEELKEVLEDMHIGIKRIAKVVQHLNTLSFRLKQPTHLLGNPFEGLDE